MTTEQITALHTFAQENGRRWKSYLRAEWMNATAGPLLMQLRNDPAFGPEGLAKFRYRRPTGMPLPPRRLSSDQQTHAEPGYIAIFSVTLNGCPEAEGVTPKTLARMLQEPGYRYIARFEELGAGYPSPIDLRSTADTYDSDHRMAIEYAQANLSTAI